MKKQDEIQLIIRLDLQFFSGEKTEKPTAKKLKDARSEGQVAKSQEVGTAFLFLSSFFVLKMMAGKVVNTLTKIMYESFNIIKNYEAYFAENPADQLYTQHLKQMTIEVLGVVLPIALTMMTIGVISNLVQVGWHPTSKVLKPKFSKLNPISGFKRMFSIMALVELVKSLLKFSIIASVVYSQVKDRINMLPSIPFMSVGDSVIFFADLVFDIGISVGSAYIGIALADFIFQKMKHTKDLKMSKQEIKDEYKQSEGDPQVKGQIKQRMREAAMRRMMQDVPSADVIITNPTHYAVAIRYKHNQDFAPMVVAKGVDHIAKNIREKGKEHNIEIVENKPLARALYASVEIGEPIPPDLYQSVAEILAFVYKLKNKL